MALGMAIYKPKAKKTVEDAAAEEERICMAAEAAGENAKSDEEASTGSVVWVHQSICSPTQKRLGVHD